MLLTLYSYYRSSSSYRVRIGLNLKGLPYEVFPIHLVKDGGEQFLPEFTARNPSSKVPVLLHNQTSIAQSVAIFEYLEDLFPEVALYPKTPLARAQTRQMVEIINSDIQPFQNVRVLKYLVKECQFDEATKMKWTKDWIEDGFSALEPLVKTHSAEGRFCVGDTPSVMDCFLIPQVYNANRFQVDMSQFPTLKAIDEHCLTLEPFQKAHPAMQVDTPEDQRFDKPF